MRNMAARKLATQMQRPQKKSALLTPLSWPLTSRTLRNLSLYYGTPEARAVAWSHEEIRDGGGNGCNTRGLC